MMGGVAHGRIMACLSLLWVVLLFNGCELTAAFQPLPMLSNNAICRGPTTQIAAVAVEGSRVSKRRRVKKFLKERLLAPFKSKTKYKTLCPRWNELFQVPLKKGEVQPRLEVLLYDEDEVSSPDFMGRISIEISEFCSTKAAKREWFTLLPEEGKSENVKGAVELIAQWWYNPALDFEPFMEPDDHKDEPPNELRVAVVAARDLAIKDKNLLSRLRCLHPILRRLPISRSLGLRGTSRRRRARRAPLHAVEASTA